jgi:hypothetical protein
MADLYRLPDAGTVGVAGPAPGASGGEVPRAAGRARRLSEGEYTFAATVAALVAVLALLGFVNSFAAVMAAARPSFGHLAFTVPIGIDLGIAVFAALDIVLARLDMRLRWLRLIPWTLTAATVYLNVATEHALFGRIAHAVLPGLWVIAVEVGAHVVRVRAGIEAGTRLETIRPSRWLLAPWPTAKLWRRMVLWEIRSYPAALGRERDRLLALTDLQDTYGPFAWRWKAPRRTRALYRLGELTPTTATGEDADRAAITGAGDHHTGHPVSHPASRPGGHRGAAPAAAQPDSRPAKATGKTSNGRAATTTDRRTAKARALLAADPAMSGAELGRRLKVSERTGSRLRNRLAPPATDPDADTDRPVAAATTNTTDAAARLGGTEATDDE